MNRAKSAAETVIAVLSVIGFILLLGALPNLLDWSNTIWSTTP